MQIAIVQRRLTHYRVPLFERLRARLADEGHDLLLIHGQPAPHEEEKRDAGELDWALRIRNRYAPPTGSKHLCWQPLPDAVRAAHLLIIAQENRLLSNYPFLLRRRPAQRLAFWGHGANLQAGRTQGLSERFKRWTTNRVDWWFAYSDASFELVARAGFPPERITVLNNAVDTAQLQQLRGAIPCAQTRALRDALGFGESPVGIYLGSLYADKRLEFLIEAAQAVRHSIPQFRLMLMGDGPERSKVLAWIGRHDWIRWVGAQTGSQKVAHLLTGQVMLNPGAVGLVLLDSFALGLPLVTTHCGIHGPEIAYLQNGCNGVMTENSTAAYARAVVQLLTDAAQRARLRDTCLASAAKYSIDDMTQRYVAGMRSALLAPSMDAARVPA